MLSVSFNQDDYKIAIIAAFCFFVVVYNFIRYLIESKRKKEIEDYCEKNKITYTLLMEKADLEKVGSDLLDYYNKVIAVMSGDIEGYKYLIFDLFSGSIQRHGSYGGYNAITKTKCIIYKDNIDLPHFYLRDESIVYDHILDSKEEDINFSDDPIFSKKFILMGPSESKVRSFFDRKIRDYFVKNHICGYVYEGYNNSFEITVDKVLSINERLVLLNNCLRFLKNLLCEKDKNR